ASGGRDEVEILDVVDDLVLAVFACHPARADRTRGAVLFEWIVEIEATQRLRRENEARAVVQRLQRVREWSGELSVAVTRDPDLADLRSWCSDLIDARRSRDADVTLDGR